MHKSVQTIGCCLAQYIAGYAALDYYTCDSSAVSATAQAIRKEASAVMESVERSQVLFGGKNVAISKLKAIEKECAEKGWDGADADPVDPLAVICAERFLRVLPDNIPLPELAPEPDGFISLDWIQSRNRLFSLSVCSSYRLAYAWLDGTDKGQAVAHFDGERIPPGILEGIASIMNHV